MKLFNKNIISVFVFVISFIIYILTAAPGLMFSDSGELASVCTTLGIAHPTGYPLFTILGYLWTKLPLPISNIQSLNIFAAFLTAFSALVFYHLCYIIIDYLSQKQPGKPIESKSKRNTKKNSGFNKLWSIEPDKSALALISFAIALMYSFAETVWQLATSIEVYSLQALLVNLILLTFMKAIIGKEQKYFLLSAFLIGLGFSNHMTTLLLLPAILFLYFKRQNEKFNFSSERLKGIAILFIPLLLGLSIYLYLPIRAASMPEFNWGWVSRSWAKFYYHISGKQYQVWMFSDMNFITKNFLLFLKSLPYQLGFIGIISFFAGSYAIFRVSRELFWFMFFLIIFNLAYTLNYSILDINTYFLSAFMAIILLSGAGLLILAKKYLRLIPFFIAIPVISLVINFEGNNESGNRLVPEYTKILVNGLEPNAIIISGQWDYFCSAFWYMQKVEGFRRDVVLVDKELCRHTWYLKLFSKWYPKTAKKSETEIKLLLEDNELFESEQPYNIPLIKKKYVDMFNSIIDKNYGQRPVYITIDIINSEPGIGKNYEKIPQGFALRLVKGNEFFPAKINPYNLGIFIESLRYRKGYLVDGIRKVTSVNVSNIGNYALFTNRPDEAEKAFHLALTINPKNNYALDGLRRLGKHPSH